MSLIKQKQIAGLSAALNALVLKDTELTTAVGNISLGNPSLEGNTLKLPFTKGDGTTVERTVDLSSLSLDINVQSAVIDQNGNLVITETDGQIHTVSILDYVQSYINANVLPQIQTLTDDLASLDGRVENVEGDLSQAQQDIDTLNQSTLELTSAVSEKANSADVYTKAQVDSAQAIQDTAIADAQTTADNAQTAADDAQAAVDSLALNVYTKSEIDSAQATQNTAISDAQAAADEAQAAVNALDLRVEALEAIGTVVEEVTPLVTLADGDLASNYEIPTGIKYVSSVLVNGKSHSFGSKTHECYLSKDAGVTAVTKDVAGAKLYWNGSKSIELETTDVICLVMIG